jgi:molecular chaperone HtpG
MSIKSQKETLNFEAEVKQLLNLMAKALYSNKEIFLRELISNASDAADRLRFEALSDAALFETDPDLKITVTFDKKAQTVTVSDNGIGMSREDVIANIGTIAKSGTYEFLQSLSGDQKKDAQLIGQFGVGFYSAFVVADKVTILSRRAGLTPEHGVRWESFGDGNYTIENIEKTTRGTDVILHLKSEEDDFLDDFRLREIIKKYSDHISIPILMQKSFTPDEEKKETVKEIEWETVNRAKALWTLPRSQITDEEYKELYKHIAHDFDDPMLWSHNKVEGKMEYISLLYIPTHPPFDLWQPDHRHGLKLYVKRVFIMDDVDQFLPTYLRFVKGIIDSNDLPLNISREILQSSDIIVKIRAALVKRILNMLSKLMTEDPEKYSKFWHVFGKVLKEGPAEDFVNREEIAKLLRFASTHTDDEIQNISLEDYVSRMKEGQDKIYYITAESFNAARNSPHLEIFRKKGIEVLLLCDRIDEWLVTHLTEFNGKTLQSVAKGDLDLGTLEDQETKESKEQEQKDFESILKQVKEILKDKIKEARLTHRLTDSPACIVADNYDINLNMQRILKSIGREAPVIKPIFELNPEHPIVAHLKEEQSDDRFAEWVNILFDQAVLAEGGQLEDPATFVAKLNKFLQKLV